MKKVSLLLQEILHLHFGSPAFLVSVMYLLPEMKKSVMQQLNCNTKENRMSVESIAEFIGSAADFDIDILYDMSSVHMQHLYSLKHILNVENTPVLIKLLWPSELGQLSLQLSSSLPTKFQCYSYFVCLNMGQKRRVDWLLEKNEQQRFHPQSVYIPQGINLEIYRKSVPVLLLSKPWPRDFQLSCRTGMHIRMWSQTEFMGLR